MSRAQAFTRPRGLVPLLFAVAGDAGGFNPVDATTYFSGTFEGTDPATGETGISLNIPFNCLIRGAVIQTFVGGTLGSNEAGTFSIRINGTTNTTLSAAITFTAQSTIFNISGLTIALNQGDRLQLRFVAPTWATNPTVVLYQCTLLLDQQ